MSIRGFSYDKTTVLPELLFNITLCWSPLAAANGHSFSSDELKTLNYFEKCKLLNANPILLARHFQHRVLIFLKEILLISTSPLCKVEYYARRIEFQVEGFLHVHTFSQFFVGFESACIIWFNYRFSYRVSSVVSANLPCKIWNCSIL